MRFWDTSALVPLIVQERRSEEVTRLLEADRGMTVWWATPVECASAIARYERGGIVTTDGANDASDALRELQADWTEIPPSARLRELARRLLRTHPLRAADALQLAAALIAAEEEPETLGFVCLDERLTHAAQREGFTVTP